MHEKLYEAVAVMISDILGACLTNLQRFISMRCLSTAIEKREESVRDAVCCFGKTLKILKLQEQRAVPSLDPYQIACIDEWRSLYMQKKPLPSYTAESEIASSDASDVYLTIE